MRETQTANGSPQSAAPEGGEMLLSEDQIGVLFDQMADEYDQIKDVWYAWLFSRLHYLLVTSLGKFQFEPKRNVWTWAAAQTPEYSPEPLRP